MWAFSLPPSFHFPSTYVCDYRLIHICVYMYIYNIHKYISILVISFDGKLRASWLFIIFQCASHSVSRSGVSDFLWPHGCSMLGPLSITNSQGLLRLMSIKSVMPSNHLILCRPLLLPPSIFPSIRVSH